MAKSNTQSGFSPAEKAVLTATLTLMALTMVALVIAAIQDGDLGAQLVVGFGLAIFAYAGWQVIPSKAQRQSR